MGSSPLSPTKKKVQTMIYFARYIDVQTTRSSRQRVKGIATTLYLNVVRWVRFPKGQPYPKPMQRYTFFICGYGVQRLAFLLAKQRVRVQIPLATPIWVCSKIGLMHPTLNRGIAGSSPVIPTKRLKLCGIEFRPFISAHLNGQRWEVYCCLSQQTTIYLLPIFIGMQHSWLMHSADNRESRSSTLLIPTIKPSKMLTWYCIGQELTCEREHLNSHFIRLCGKVGLIRLPVTQEIASSSLVRVANKQQVLGSLLVLPTTYYRFVSHYIISVINNHKNEF